MKKVILAMILLIINCVFINVYAISTCNTGNKFENKKEVSMDFELLPTMDSKSDAKNQVWVGTFQLVWNDLIDELVKHPIEFVGYKSAMAEALNKKSFGVNDLSESSYYKKLGLASPELKIEIEDGIKQKFNEKSDILDSIDWTPADKKYILYAMLKKDFEFVEKFVKLDKGKFNGSEGEVEYFGINDDSMDAQRKSVSVLFYNNKDNYAVALKSKQGDIVQLYRTNDNKTLSDYYKDMNEMANKRDYTSFLTEEDQFKAPMMDFKSIREFDELCNKEIKNSDLIISKAIETIQFKMDEAGVKLKSEAAIATEFGCLPSFKPEPRYFYFDDKFVMFISEEGKKPYFAMKVTDAAKLQDK